VTLWQLGCRSKQSLTSVLSSRIHYRTLPFPRDFAAQTHGPVSPLGGPRYTMLILRTFGCAGHTERRRFLRRRLRSVNRVGRPGSTNLPFHARFKETKNLPSYASTWPISATHEQITSNTGPEHFRPSILLFLLGCLFAAGLGRSFTHLT
jgi:hypothetical protein